MESLLKQSKAVCPFLKKTSTSTLRALSTSASNSACGGTMSNLTIVAKRCPIMSKAIAVQSVRPTAAVQSKQIGARNAFARGYVVPSNPKNFIQSGKRNAHTTEIDDVHIKAGVFDTSKGICDILARPLHLRSNADSC